MSDMDIYKAITPLDYSGSGRSFTPVGTTKITSGSTSVTWIVTVGDFQVSYGQPIEPLVLMDEMLLGIPGLENRYTGNLSGTITYKITLSNSPDHYLRRYCRISFGASFSSNALSKLVINSQVTTPWNTNGYKELITTFMPSSGIINPRSVTTPTFEVDWTDLTRISKNMVLS
jgi:hypothetical protein